MAESKEIIVISDRSAPENIYSDIRSVPTVHDLPEHGCYAVVLDLQRSAWSDELLQIRQREHYQLIPLFFWGKAEDKEEQLFDGPFDSRALMKAGEIQERISLLPSGKLTEDIELWLLSYLFCREGFVLKGYFNYHNSAGFGYPLLNLLLQNDHSENNWLFLQSMVSRDLLKHERVVDEIQVCPHCNGALLNFKNCCPNCQSIDTTLQQFVHCFTCGNIGPISTFLKHDQLICDRCNSKLRHIGIDYDKPLEDKLCNQCSFNFFEAEVMTICLVCLKLTKPNDLNTQKIYEYSLAKRGEQLVRGRDQVIFPNIDQFFKIIDYQSFKLLLNWQIKLSKRYQDHIFSLIVLKVTNIEVLIEHYGLLNTEKILEQFFERLCSLFRDSDLVTREDNSLLYFLPMTPGERVQLIFDKVMEFTAKQFSNKEEIPLNIQLGYMTSLEIIEADLSDQLLIAELFNRIHDYD